jgi:hypothetical protein
VIDRSGVCTIVRRNQQGFRPLVYGMGILVKVREVVTCAHVIDAALGEDWLQGSDPGIVNVCFPFTERYICIKGTVDRRRWFAPGRTSSGEPSDIAVIELETEVPASVEPALLSDPVVGATVKAYGFRGKEIDGVWKSHPDGQWAEGKIAGPQPGGRVQFEGFRPTGARIERGFSGGGAYDAEQDAVVGMIVESDREKEIKVAQFIDVASLRKAVGLIEPYSILHRRHGPNAPSLTLDEVERLVEQLTHQFFGRDDQLLAFDRFVLDNEHGVIILTAPGGLGKSALLANWGRRQEQRGALVAWHFFNGTMHRTVQPTDALKGLLYQTAVLRGSHPPDLSDDISKLEDQLNAELRKDASAKAPLIVLIDELDEAAQALQPIMPAGLGKHVYIKTRLYYRIRPRGRKRAPSPDRLMALSSEDSRLSRRALSTGAAHHHRRDAVVVGTCPCRGQECERHRTESSGDDRRHSAVSAIHRRRHSPAAR